MPGDLEAFLRLSRPAGTPRPPAARTVLHHRGGAPRPRTACRRPAPGPLLTDAERRYLTCDATCRVWFTCGRVIGAGRTTPGGSAAGCRCALEHRHRDAWFPGCGATHGLHAYIRHWKTAGHRTVQPGPGLPLSTTGHIITGLIAITGPPGASPSPA